MIGNLKEMSDDLMKTAKEAAESLDGIIKGNISSLPDGLGVEVNSIIKSFEGMDIKSIQDIANGKDESFNKKVQDIFKNKS